MPGYGLPLTGVGGVGVAARGDGEGGAQGEGWVYAREEEDGVDGLRCGEHSRGDLQ